MSSTGSSPWIYEPETTRWYVNWVDQYGRIVRRYADELAGGSSTSNQQLKTTGYDEQRPPAVADPQYQRRDVGSYPSGTQGSQTSYDSDYGSNLNTGNLRDSRRYQGYNDSREAMNSSTLRADYMGGDMNMLSINDFDREPQYTASPASEPTPVGQSQGHGSGTSYPKSPVTFEGGSTRTIPWPSLPVPVPEPNSSIPTSQSVQAIGIPQEQQSGQAFQSVNRRHIFGTPGTKETLDPRYRIRNHDYKQFFCPGRVFSTLWTDPSRLTTNQNQTFTSEVMYGEKVFTKIRRFIVVRQRDKSCTCLPVTSYGGRGFKKIGIDIEEHGQIYGRQRPKVVDGICKKPLKVILSNKFVRFDDISLVNYGRMYSVETNVKVLDVGVLDDESHRRLLRYYHDVNFRPEDYPDDLLISSDHKKKDTDLASAEANLASMGQSYRNYPDLVANPPQMMPSSGSSSYYPGPSKPTPPYSTSYYHQNSYPNNRGSFPYSSPGFADTVQSSAESPFVEPERNVFVFNQQYGGEDPNSNLSRLSYDDSEEINLQPFEQVKALRPLGYQRESVRREPQSHGSSERSRDGRRREERTSRGTRASNWREKSQRDDLSEIKATSHPVEHPDSSSNFPLPMTPVTQSSQPSPQGQSDMAQSGETIVLQKGMKSTLPPHKQTIEAEDTGISHPPASHLDVSTANLNLNSSTGGKPPQLPHTIPASSVHAPKLQSTPDESPTVGLANAACEERGDREPVERPASPSSSIASIASMLFSTRSSFSLSESSLASVVSQPQLTERLVALLYEEEELQFLYSDALGKTPPERFERNFRRGLIEMSANLRNEATSAIERQTARIIQKFSRNVAHIIRTKLQSQNKDETIHELGLGASRGNDDADSNASNDGDLDPLDDFEEGSNPLKDLETFVLRSNSMKLLKDSLRRFVYPDPAQFALAKIWPFGDSKTSSCSIPYRLDWEAHKFLSSSFPAGQRLRNVLTLTGDVVNAQALSCQDYISVTWKEFGPLFLQGLEMLLESLNANSKDPVIVQNDNAKIILNVDANENGSEVDDFLDSNCRSIENITVTATHAIHSQVVSMLAWICAAVRPSATRDIMLSSSKIEASQETEGVNKIIIRMGSLESIPKGGTCWHSILPHSVIAKGFRIRDRKRGQGLEISFADMALFCHALRYVEIEGGLVLDGLQSLLIPTQELQDDNALQWHYEDKRWHKQQGRRTVSRILKQNGGLQWYKDLDPLRLSQKRCFLGWVEKAAVTIGTDAHLSTTIRWSGSRTAPRIEHVNTHSMNFGSSGAGFVTFEKAVARERVPMPSKFTFDIDKDIYDTFNDDEKAHVMVYDNGTKTAWCLPQANVVLHLVYRIIQRRKYQLFDGEKSATLRHPGTDTTCAAAALRILKSSLSYRVIKHESESGVVEERLSHTIKQVWHLLNAIRDKLWSVVDEFESVGEGPPKKLYGIEFAAVLAMSQSMSVKRIDVNQPWVHLTSEDPLVLCCKGLGQPIVPTTSNQLCRPWKSVPHGQNFLVATAAAIKYFLYQQHQGPDGSRLNARLEWLCGSTLVQNHNDHHEHEPISHVQLVRSVRDCSLDKQLIGKVRSCRNGCFIFSATGPRLACLRALEYRRKAPRRRLTKAPPVPQCSDYRAEKSSLIRTFETDNASDTSPDSETYLRSSLYLTDSTSSYESQDYVTEAPLCGNANITHQPFRATMSVPAQRGGNQQLPRNMSLQVVDEKIDIPRYLSRAVPKSLRHKKKMTGLRILGPKGDESETKEAHTRR